MIISFLNASLSKEIVLYINKRMKSGKNIRKMMMMMVMIARGAAAATGSSIKTTIYVPGSMLWASHITFFPYYVARLLTLQNALHVTSTPFFCINK